MSRTLAPLPEMDLRDAEGTNIVLAAPYYDKLVSVHGSTKGGTAVMLGVLTGVTFAGDSVIVYMEGQQITSFDSSKSGIWIQELTPSN